MADFLAPENLRKEKPIRVLHVDDDPARGRLSETLLTEYISDVETFTETDPKTANERLEGGLIVDCVVSDFDMGVMDGLGFLETVRERSPNLPFILFTGKGSEEIASEAISAGVTDYLQKGGGPDQYAVLANRIENVVSQYRAERATKSYQRRMNDVYERVTDAFFALDTDWRFTFLNGRAEELLNRTEDDLLGRLVWDEFPDALNSQFEDEYRQAMKTQEPTTFEAYFEPLETLFEVRAYPSEEGLSVFFRDVTAQARMREEHRREKELLERVFGTSPIGILVVDSEGAIKRANDRMVELLELTEDEITNRTYDSAEWTITDEEGNPFPEENHPLAPVFGDGETVRGERIGYGSPSGEWSLRSVSAAPIHTEDGTLGRVVITVEDVTEARERRRELERQNERLDEFASVVSHDLRNPLNVAQVRTRLARDEQDSEHLEEVEIALDRMETLITDLLTLSRQGRVVGDPEPIHLDHVLHNAWSTTGTDAATLDIDGRLETVQADESRLRELLENLLDNAITHAGADATIRVEATPGGFAIEDDGSGIPPERRDQIFEDGYSTGRDGTGFGLSIVKQIADAYDWSITVTEGDAGGARFEISGVTDSET